MIMRELRLVVTLLVCFFVIIPSLAWSGTTWTYTREDGVVVMTDRFDSIPKKYRDEAKESFEWGVKEIKNLLQRGERRRFAMECEKRLLDKGINARAILDGENDTTLKVRWAFMTRVEANSFKEGDLWRKAEKIGFKKIVLENITFYHALESGEPVATFILHPDDE